MSKTVLRLRSIGDRIEKCHNSIGIGSLLIGMSMEYYSGKSFYKEKHFWWMYMTDEIYYQVWLVFIDIKRR